MMEKFGRRQILITSIASTFFAIIIYIILFIRQSCAPKIDHEDSKQFSANAICQPYVPATNPSSWYCAKCMKNNCGFNLTKGKEVLIFLLVFWKKKYWYSIVFQRMTLICLCYLSFVIHLCYFLVRTTIRCVAWISKT
jgi:hypothetical protein